MRLCIKRFDKTLFTLFKRYFKTRKLNFPNNKQIIKNNMESIITLGHYQSKDSLRSEKPDIIRILGPDQKRDGYWLTQDNKSIPSYELENNWIKIYTASSEKQTIKAPIDIFAGIGEFSEVLENEVNYEQQIENPSNKESIITYSEKQIQKQIQKPIQKTEVKIPFDISIIEKINIDTLNKKAFDSLGIENKYKKPIINIELPITFNYDIDKLKQTIELLELNENIIVDYLVSEISINNIQPLIKQELKKLLIRKELYEKVIIASEFIEKSINKNIEELPIIENLYIETKIIEEPIINIEVIKGISEIEEYLKSII